MDNLSERQKLILALVIRDYIETAQPVGSLRVVENFSLEISSATVRNEMVALTELGYLRQPHTSAGRVPTEEGYRYFVRQLMVHTDLPTTTKRTIVHQFYQAGFDVERWMRLAASVLAHQAQAASLVTAPRPEIAFFKHLELINTHGRQVLMVLVLSGGEVSQQMLTLAEPVSQEKLSAVAQTINSLCVNLDAKAILSCSNQAGALEKDIFKLVIDEMRRFSQTGTGELYHDGLTQVLAEPEFGEIDLARRALRFFEERTVLDDLLSRTVLTNEMGGVQVLIGGEGTWEELKECSMVLARYGSPGRVTGTLGVLGPMRMPYGRTISTVRFVAGLLSDLVEDMITD
ncbi:MAG TPA: heat-inducible transcriptional repressor HrcA [Anaerolineales bacterium]|nr:heat-inducible transcriptional repressor HrcA [Anaerolineales bacterium]